MTGRVLVDTSVWVDHFRQRNAPLVALLLQDAVLIHPLVLGELACGTPPSRTQTLADLQRLQSAQQATVREVMALVERERLFGLGCGLVAGQAMRLDVPHPYLLAAFFAMCIGWYWLTSHRERAICLIRRIYATHLLGWRKGDPAAPHLTDRA